MKTLHTALSTLSKNRVQELQYLRITLRHKEDFQNTVENQKRDANKNGKLLIIRGNTLF